MQANQEPATQVRRLADKQFLGPEFLTWLYFTLLESNMEVALPEAFDPGTDVGATAVGFEIGKRVSLHTVDATGARIAMTGPGLDDSGEVLQAIRRGALLGVLTLDMAIQSRVYSFTLRADDGSIVGLKLPDLFTEEEPTADGQPVDPLKKKQKRRPSLPLEDILALRMQCAREVERVVGALFERFLARRLSREWSSDDLGLIRSHVTDGLERRVPARATP